MFVGQWIAKADVFHHKRLAVKFIEKLVFHVEGASHRCYLMTQKLAAVDLRFTQVGCHHELAARFEDPADLSQRGLERRSSKVVHGVERDNPRERSGRERSGSHVTAHEAGVPSASPRLNKHLESQIQTDHSKATLGEVLTDLARSATKIEDRQFSVYPFG
jgi:hypothetical protein